MKQAGVTLVELLTVMAIGVILLGIGMPGYAYLMNQSRLSGLTNELVAALNLARSEAVKRGVRVTVCKSGNAEAESPICDPDADWLHGWLVFVDRGVAGQLDESDQLLRVQQSHPTSQASITPTNFSAYVSYLPSGVSQGPDHLPNGTFHICLAGEKRKVVLNSTGRIRTEKGSC
jgi:type IV fimbrial biogenesis protein FimT